MNRLFITILSILMFLPGCLSEQDACVQDIEDRGDSDACIYWLTGETYAGNPENAPDEREQARSFASGFLPFCIKYLLDLDNCNEKSDFIRDLPL
jgi:hypothetical protein